MCTLDLAVNVLLFLLTDFQLSWGLTVCSAMLGVNYPDLVIVVIV